MLQFGEKKTFFIRKELHLDVPIKKGLTLNFNTFMTYKKIKQKNDVSITSKCFGSVLLLTPEKNDLSAACVSKCVAGRFNLVM